MPEDGTEPIAIVWTEEAAPEAIDYTWSEYELVPIYLMEKAATPTEDAAATS